jgi:hypothetical protein
MVLSDGARWLSSPSVEYALLNKGTIFRSAYWLAILELLKVVPIFFNVS